jgi:hypothetical protein
MERKSLYVIFLAYTLLFCFREKGVNKMLERDFQPDVIDTLKKLFPGCIILKNDAKYKDGIPDLTVLYKSKYAILEVKRSYDEYIKCLKKKPKQKYYIDIFSKWAFGSYVYPENFEDVINKLKEVFK